MTPSPALARLDSIVQDFIDGERDTAQTLARLRAGGFTVDPVALLDAKLALDARDRFLYRDGDPYAFVGIPGPRPGVDVWQLAIDKAETDYMTALLCMARPSRVRGVA